MQRNPIKMQIDTDENSLNSSLFTHGYSNLLDGQIQNHAMTGFPSLGEAMISFSRGGVAPHFADESWNIQTGKNTPGGFSIATSSYHQIGSIHDMDNVITSTSAVVNPTFDSTNYSLEGLPFVQESGNVMNPWMLAEDLNSNNPGLSGFSNELSLSLATSHKRHVGSDSTSCSSNSLSMNVNSYRSPLPALSGSRFLHAMQEILAEIACYALENFDQVSYSEGRSCSRFRLSDGIDLDNGSSMFHNNLESKKKHLLSLLQAVDDRYNQCLDEIHTVISAFHAVSELDPNLHARFALPTLSLMYRNLRERISSYILAMSPSLSEGEERENNSFQTSFIQKQWALQQLRKGDHQLWRPQRGLPERSVSVLRAWMFQNFLHPYPKDSEKHLLALKSGLTRSQVSNWFINARVRLWKPMIDEMYAEMNRRKVHRNEEETNGSLRNLLHFDKTRFIVD